jgi:large subunit ribosomal protein L24
MIKMKLKTGDHVMVISGKDAGKKGKITQVFPKEQRVVVEGVNSMTKNVRSRDSKEQGQRIQYFAPIHVSNVMMMDPKLNKPTRVGSMMVGEKRVRKAIRSKEAIS